MGGKREFLNRAGLRRSFVVRGPRRDRRETAAARKPHMKTKK